MTQKQLTETLIANLCEERAIARREIKRRSLDLYDAVERNLPEIDDLRAAVVGAELVAERYDNAIWAIDKVSP